MTKKFFCLFFVILLLFCSCGTKQPTQPLLGVNLALTGESAPFGTACLKGIELALEEYEKIKGKEGQIKLLVKDNASRSDLARRWEQSKY